MMVLSSGVEPPKRGRVGRLLLILLRCPRYIPALLVLVLCALLLRARHALKRVAPRVGSNARCRAATTRRMGN